MLTFFIDKENKLIIEKYTDVTRIGTIEKLMVNIWAHSDYEQYYDRIVDFQDSNLIFSREELKSFIKVISENSKSMRGRAAVLVRESGSAAIVTMYEDQMKHLHKIGIFCSESEVIKFLDIDDSVFDKLHSADAVTITLAD